MRFYKIELVFGASRPLCATEMGLLTDYASDGLNRGEKVIQEAEEKAEAKEAAEAVKHSE